MVRVERRGRATWLVFDRPQKLNAFTGAGYGELRDGLASAVADHATRVIVLTGVGRAFSAGADRSLVDGTADGAERARAGHEFDTMLDQFTGCDKPVIAAVNGLAVGIGCTMLLHCDLVVVAESARLQLPFTALGIAPEAASSLLLPARARWGDVMWSMLSSEWIDAGSAVAMGLAWRSVPDADLRGRVDELATKLAEVDPAAVAAAKRLLIAGRADAVRAAMARERSEMSALLEQGRR